MLRVQAADSAKRAEELQQQLSACQVMQPLSAQAIHARKGEGKASVQDRIHQDLGAC